MTYAKLRAWSRAMLQRIRGAWRVLIGRAEGALDAASQSALSDLADEMRIFSNVGSFILNHERTNAVQFIKTEEKELVAMITDALNALNAARDAVLAKLSNDAAAVTQANADRDAAVAKATDLQGQLDDAEAKINAVAQSLNPPAA